MTTIHNFASTGEAYDACQCDDNIKTGDILVIASERVVGLAWAWPIALTKATGHFHRAKDCPEMIYNYKNERVFTNEQIAMAVEMADKMNRRRKRKVNLMAALERSLANDY